MWGTVWNSLGVMHVVPLDDCIEGHWLDAWCPCLPEVDWTAGDLLTRPSAYVTHNSYDGRERYETLSKMDTASDTILAWDALQPRAH